MSASDFNAIWSMWSVWKYNIANQMLRQKAERINKWRKTEKSTKHSFNIHHIHGSIIANKKREQLQSIPADADMKFFFLLNGTYWVIAQSQTYRCRNLFEMTYFIKKKWTNKRLNEGKKANIVKSHLFRYKMMFRLLVFRINLVHMVWKMLWLNRFKISECFHSLPLHWAKKQRQQDEEEKYYISFFWRRKKYYEWSGNGAKGLNVIELWCHKNSFRPFLQFMILIIKINHSQFLFNNRKKNIYFCFFCII